MKINPDIFRGYDIRGNVGEDLSGEVMERLGLAYGTWLTRRKVSQVVVGRDARPSSEEYKNAFIKGLLATGMAVTDLGMALTAMTYWAQYEFKSIGSAMVTASHNPIEFNGLKLGSGFSKTVIADDVQEIRQIAESGNFTIAQGEARNADIREKYYDDLLRRARLTRKLKVAVDTANGTPGLFVKDFFTKAGAEVVEFNTEVKGEMPLGTPDPTDEVYLSRLAKETTESGSDVGLAFDTDGDRFGVVDEKGQLIWNDVMAAILAKDILERCPGAIIVYNTLCSRLLTEMVETAGGKAVMAMVGHSFVEQKMQETGAIFGGELSGHFFFGDNFYGFDDGFYSVLRLLDYLSRQEKTLGQIVGEMPKYISSPEIKLWLSGRQGGETEAQLKTRVMTGMVKLVREKFPDGQFRAEDGVRADFPDGMVVVRASQNGPYLAVRFEARKQEKYDQLKAALKEILAGAAEVDFGKGVNAEALG